MNVQEYINNAVSAARQKTLSQSDQLTLGELILKLEPIAEREKAKELKEQATVVFDFEYLFPTAFSSWRGIYAELALGFGADNYQSVDKPIPVTEFLMICRNAVGREFTGYKGGEFMMSKHTPIWVANYGNAGNTALIDVVDNDYQVILITAYRNA